MAFMRPSLSHAGFLVVILAGLLTSSCSNRKHYEWNAKLLQVRGELVEVLRPLPLGSFEGAIEYPAPKDKIHLSNVQDLSAFVNRQEEDKYPKENLLADVTAWYKCGEGKLSPLAYLALMKTGTQPRIEKEPSIYTSVMSLPPGSPSGSVSFRPRQLTGLLPDTPDARLYYVYGSLTTTQNGMSFDQDRNQLVLAARKNNVYMEVAIPFNEDDALGKKMQELGGYEIFSGEERLEPFDLSALSVDWSHPTLKTLREAHEASGLGLVRFE